jgi:hypothetical protein
MQPFSWLSNRETGRPQIRSAPSRTPTVKVCTLTGNSAEHEGDNTFS